jgi:hypothetical protein
MKIEQTDPIIQTEPHKGYVGLLLVNIGIEGFDNDIFLPFS